MDTDEWLRVGIWCLLPLALAYWFRSRRRRLERPRRVAGVFACIVGLGYVATGALIANRARFFMVYDNPERDHERRRDVFLIGAVTLLAGASSLKSGVALLRGRSLPVRAGVGT